MACKHLLKSRARGSNTNHVIVIAAQLSWVLIRIKRRRRHGSGKTHFLRDPALGHGSLGELLGCHPTLGAASGAVQQRALQYRGSALADCPASAHSAQGEHPRHGSVSACLRGGSTQKYSLSAVTGRAHWQLNVLLQDVCHVS